MLPVKFVLCHNELVVEVGYAKTSVIITTETPPCGYRALISKHQIFRIHIDAFLNECFQSIPVFMNSEYKSVENKSIFVFGIPEKIFRFSLTQIIMCEGYLNIDDVASYRVKRQVRNHLKVKWEVNRRIALDLLSV